MKERPILMSAPMVRAINAGTKTQTRRVVKPDGKYRLDLVCPPDGGPSRCPYGQPGDRLRVKEAAWMWCERRPNGKTKAGRQKWLYVPMREAPIHYASDHPRKPAVNVVSPDTGNQWGWRLKVGRFLPRWASRITLEVTGVRVERLQDISEADAVAEGCDPIDTSMHGQLERTLMDLPLLNDKHPYRNGYALLWEQINGPGSWDENPWVWAISFRRVEA